MGGGVGALILLALLLAAGIAVMLLTLNARWKSGAQLRRQARENVVGATLLVLLAAAGVFIAAYVVMELI